MNEKTIRSAWRSSTRSFVHAFILLVSPLAASGASPKICNVLDEASRGIPPELRHSLAGKPAAWIVKAHDVGVPTDVHKDVPWHLLDKEKDPRFNLPHRGKLGLFNPTADVHWLVGMSVDDAPIDFNPKRQYVDHLVNLAAQKADLGEVQAQILFLPMTSDTVLAVIDVIHTGSQPRTVNLETLCTKPAGPNQPAIEEPAAAWGRPTGRYGYGITITSGRIEAVDRVDSRSVMLRFEELDQERKTDVGSLLCTLTGSAEPSEAKVELNAPAGPLTSLSYRVALAAGEHRQIKLAFSLHRYAPRQIETANHIVLYPAETDQQARAYTLQAATAAVGCDWLSIAKESFKPYRRMPAIELPNPSWAADFYCALELPRGNTWSPQGVLKQPWYTFCRVNGHEPYGWWSYGMHGHEDLSTFVVNLTEPSLSQSYLRGQFQVQQPDGCIQYGVDPSGKNCHEPLATAPLLAGEAWQAYLWSGDRQFLEQAYGACSQFVAWWRSPARTRGAGLQHWRDFLETVRDDKDLATWTASDGAENQEALDLNCYLLNEEHALEAMARELGRTDEAARWKAEAETRINAMRKPLWHAEDGVFYGKDIADGRWARVKDISTFFPLWCGLATPEQADSIVRLLHDPLAFGTAYPIATLAVKNMPDKMRGQYHWRGANWVEMTWLAIQGLSRYGRHDEAARLAETNCRMVFDTLEKTSHFREFYNSITGQPSDLTDYIWTAMPAIMIVETFFGVRPTPEGLDIRPALPKGWNEIRITNLHIRDTVVSLKVSILDASESTATVNGKPYPSANAGRISIPWSQLGSRCEIDYTLARREYRRN